MSAAAGLIIGALLAGAVNAVVAYQELDRRCRFLPFFKPSSSLPFYGWILLQVFVPAILFFALHEGLAKPLPSPAVALLGLVFGFGFTGVLNCEVSVGEKTIDVKPIYLFFVGLAYTAIADRESGRAAEFWAGLKQRLIACKNWEPGLEVFAQYLSVRDSVTNESNEAVQEQITAILKEKNQESGATLLLPHIKTKVTRRNLPGMLRSFGVDEQYIVAHFPKAKAPAPDPAANPEAIGA